MWMQIVGKICLAHTPIVNHFWNIAFQITPRGLSTLAMNVDHRSLTIAFDFIAHQLVFESSDGRIETVPLAPRSVADMYRLVMDTVRRMDIEARIWTMPVEVANPVRFENDVKHASYDRGSAEALWRILVATRPVFERFRSGFIGKCSPVHFFWGSFDLAVTRFSGRRAPDRPGADSITRESYSHEVISHGFWPGGGAVPEPVFYAYAAPEPPGFKTAAVKPEGAFYNGDLSEFILPYEAVRSAPSPAAALAAFLTSTYDAGADLAQWNRAELERS
jgi:hypothetical protein